MKLVIGFCEKYTQVNELPINIMFHSQVFSNIVVLHEFLTGLQSKSGL